MSSRRNRVMAGVSWAGTLTATIVFASPAEADPRYSEWSTPVNIGAPINSPALDAGSMLTKDGLAFYHNTDRAGGLGGQDIWVSERECTDDPWGTPVNLTVLNSPAADQTVAISPDGHYLLLASARPGGLGGIDMYVSYRSDKHDNFGWGAPVNVGAGINTSDNELGPAFIRERNAIKVYFFRYNNAMTHRNIYVSEFDRDGAFGPATIASGADTTLGTPAAPDFQQGWSRDVLRLGSARHFGRLRHLGINTRLDQVALVDSGERHGAQQRGRRGSGVVVA